MGILMADNNKKIQLYKINLDRLFESAKRQSVKNFKSELTKIIFEIDKLLSEQVSAIIQHSQFKSLESSWRGIFSLIDSSISNKKVIIKILDLDWPTLSNNINSAFNIKRTFLYRRIYSDEFDTAGGLPFGLIAIDYKVSIENDNKNSFDDFYTLQLLSEICDYSLCPAILSIDENIFGDDYKRQFNDIDKLERIFKSDYFSSWQMLRQNLTSRFLHLVLPDYLQRNIYINEKAGFIFNEKIIEQNALWGNSVYLLVQNVINEFERVSWFGFLRGIEETASCGAIIQTKENIKTKVDIFIENDFFWAEHGLIPLCSIYLTEKKGFFSNQSVWDCTNKSLPQLNMLQTNLMVCRFAHYIKVKIRDSIGSYKTAENCQKDIEQWLGKYVNNSAYVSDMEMVRYPLKSFKIKIVEKDYDRKEYYCEMKLQPQIYNEMINSEITLSTQIATIG